MFPFSTAFQTTQGSFKKDSSINAGHQLQQDISSSEQVKLNLTSYGPFLSFLNYCDRRVIQFISVNPPPNQPKKRESPSFNSTQERIKSELQKKLQMREEKMNEIRQVEAVCEVNANMTSAEQGQSRT